MILKCGMKHQAIELYKFYINHDPGMTSTFFYSKVNLAHAFEWEKIGKCNLMAKNLLGMSKWTEIFMFMKIFWAQRVVCPCPRAIYMCMTIIFKHLLL